MTQKQENWVISEQKKIMQHWSDNQPPTEKTYEELVTMAENVMKTVEASAQKHPEIVPEVRKMILDCLEVIDLSRRSIYG